MSTAEGGRNVSFQNISHGEECQLVRCGQVGPLNDNHRAVRWQGGVAVWQLETLGERGEYCFGFKGLGLICKITVDRNNFTRKYVRKYSFGNILIMSTFPAYTPIILHTCMYVKVCIHKNVCLYTHSLYYIIEIWTEVLSLLQFTPMCKTPYYWKTWNTFLMVLDPGGRGKIAGVSRMSRKQASGAQGL